MAALFAGLPKAMQSKASFWTDVSKMLNENTNKKI